MRKITILLLIVGSWVRGSAQCPGVTVHFTYVSNGGTTITFTDNSTGLDGTQVYTWDFGDGSPYGTGSPVTHTYAANGTYVVGHEIGEQDVQCVSLEEYQDVNVGCSGPAITQNFSAYSVGTLGNGQYEFKDASTGADANAVYSWTFGDGSTGTGDVAQHTYTSSDSFEEVCETIEDGGCSYGPYCEHFNIIGVGGNCKGVIGFSNNPAQPDIGDTLTFDDESTGLTSSAIYFWSDDDGHYGDGQEISWTYDQAGIYEVCLTITDGICSYTEVCHDVTVSGPCDGLIDFSYGPTEPGAGDLVTFDDASTGLDDNQTYLWSDNDGHSGTGPETSWSYDVAGTYHVCESVTDGTCVYAEACQDIVVGGCNGLISFSFSPSAPGPGDSVTFDDASIGLSGSQTYAWSDDDGNTGAGAEVNFTYDTVGTYEVCETVTDGACTYAAVCQDVTIAGGSSSSCNGAIAFSYGPTEPGTGDLVTFNDASTGLDGNQTYSWTDNNGHTGTGASAAWSYAAAGTYQVCETVSDGSCTYTAVCESVTVTAAGCPGTIAFSYYPGSPGVGDLVTFTDHSLSLDGNQIYSWSDNNGHTGNVAAVSWSYTVAGTYQVCETISDGSCTYTPICRNITVGGLQNCPGTLAFSYSPASAEPGNLISFTDASGGLDGNQVYLWSDNNGHTGSAADVSWNYTAAGVYEVCEQIDDNGCGYGPSCQDVTVSAPDCTAFFTYTNTGNDNYQLTDASSGETGTTTWNWTSGTYTNSTQNPSVHIPSPGSYNICLSITTASGGCTSSNCQTIIVLPASLGCTMQAAFSKSNKGYTYQFTSISTGANANTAYQWSVDGTALSNSAGLTYSFPGAGTYQVCLWIGDSRSGCSSELCTLVTVIAESCQASFSFEVSDSHTNTFQFTNTSSGTDASATYSWNFGDGTAHSTDPNPQHIYASRQPHQVCLNLDVVDHACINEVCGNTTATAIDNLQGSANLVTLFPNPASGIININMGSLMADKIEIYSNIGEKITEETPAKNGLVTMDLDALSDGVYCVLIHSGNNIISKKFVLSK